MTVRESGNLGTKDTLIKEVEEELKKEESELLKMDIGNLNLPQIQMKTFEQ